MPRPKSSLYRRKKHGHRKTAEVQEKKLYSAETVLGDDLVQSTVQEGSHGHFLIRQLQTLWIVLADAHALHPLQCTELNPD